MKKIKYNYEKQKERYSLNKSNEMFQKSLKNYFLKLDKFNIKKSWYVNFYIFKNIKLNKNCKIDLKKSKLIKKYHLNYSNKGKKYLLDLF